VWPLFSSSCRSRHDSLTGSATAKTLAAHRRLSEPPSIRWSVIDYESEPNLGPSKLRPRFMSFELWLFGRFPFEQSEWETILHEAASFRPAFGKNKVVRVAQHSWRIDAQSSVWVEVEAPPSDEDTRVASCGPKESQWYAVLGANSGCAPDAFVIQITIPYVALAIGDGVAAHDCTAHELGCFKTPEAYASFVAKRMKWLRRPRSLQRLGLIGSSVDNPFD
jgi:hypothetical protein